MIRAVFLASMIFVAGPALAGSVLDLSAPQQGPFPSYLDLNEGRPSSWGTEPPKREETTEAAAIPVSMTQPLPLSSMAMPRQGSSSGSTTVLVSSYTRRDGTSVRSHTRSSTGFRMGRRR